MENGPGKGQDPSLSCQVRDGKGQVRDVFFCAASTYIDCALRRRKNNACLGLARVCTTAACAAEVVTGTAGRDTSRCRYHGN